MCICIKRKYFQEFINIIYMSFISHIYNRSSSGSSTTIINGITAKPPYPMPTLPTPEFGLPFCTTAVCVGDNEEQLAVPHSYPVGQQFPPKLAAQLLHPVAHTPVGLFSAAPVPTATTRVTPSLTSVVELVAGQSVVWQFRPVRQQPPR